MGSWRTGHFKLMDECFPGGSHGKESACNAGDPGSIPDLERSPGDLVFLPGEFQGQRRLAGYSLLGCKESDTTE